MSVVALTSHLGVGCTHDVKPPRVSRYARGPVFSIISPQNRISGSRGPNMLGSTSSTIMVEPLAS